MLMLSLTEEAKLGIVSGALAILILMVVCMVCKLRRLKSNGPEYKDDSMLKKKQTINKYPWKNAKGKCPECVHENKSNTYGTLKVRTASFMSLRREKGKLKFSLEYKGSLKILLLRIIQGCNLVGRDFWEPVDSYVRVKLEPDPNNLNKGQTKIIRKNLNPEYEEEFQFNIQWNELKDTILKVSVWEVDSYSRHHVIGEIEIGLGHMIKMDKSVALERDIKEPLMDHRNLGELMFSLSYLPTTERLSIVIMKARNLNPSFSEWRSEPRTINPFVKVVLLFDGHKIKKKKTSTRQQETNPVYNESMMFDIPVHLLDRVIFVISVADKLIGSTRSDVIGRVVIGSPTIGEALSHWHQMLASPRRPIAAWHRLTL